MRIRFGRGFTLIELLIVISIIAILTSMLLPSLNKAREKAKSIACSSFAGQIGKAFVFYADDNKERIPPYSNEPQNTIFWFSLGESGYFAPYLKNQGNYIGFWYGNSRSRILCPSMVQEKKNVVYYSYGYNISLHFNPHYRFMPDFKSPSRTMLIAETDINASVNMQNPLNPTSTDVRPVVCRHSNSSNILYADSHVESLKRHAIPYYLKPGYQNFWKPF